VRVLVVEDERKLAEVLFSALQAEHYDVIVAKTGEDGFYRANAELFDLVLLDLMLPGRSGLEILQTLRQRRVETPVLILTARDGIEDRVLGLDLGADDYVTKPYSPKELRARIRALLRRGPEESKSATNIRFGDCELDLIRGELRRAGRPVPTTPLEFKLLALFTRRAGHVLTRRILIDEVWGEDTAITERVVDNQIANLRRKIEPSPADPRYLKSIRGIGYRFDPEEVTES